MRVGIDVFVRLKKGTISDYYETGEVLGEGIQTNFIVKRRLREGVESNP
jgi:hypothetical protein